MIVASGFETHLSAVDFFISTNAAAPSESTRSWPA